MARTGTKTTVRCSECFHRWKLDGDTRCPECFGGNFAPVVQKVRHQSHHEAGFSLQLLAYPNEIPPVEREWRFDPKRKWRFDFAWPVHRFAVEIEGGLFSYGRHNRAAGYEADLEKYNAAVLAGWCVLRFSGSQVKRGEAIRMVRTAFGGDSARPRSIVMER